MKIQGRRTKLRKLVCHLFNPLTPPAMYPHPNHECRHHRKWHPSVMSINSTHSWNANAKHSMKRGHYGILRGWSYMKRSRSLGDPCVDSKPFPPAKHHVRSKMALVQHRVSEACSSRDHLTKVFALYYNSSSWVLHPTFQFSMGSQSIMCYKYNNLYKENQILACFM